MRPLLAVAIVGLALAGCQGSPAPVPAAAVPQVGSLTARLKAEGDELLLRQEYDKAALKYQAALNEAPSDIAIRFALATALSYLPRREETIEHFRIVVQRGAPGSPEVRTARDWLAGAGLLEGGTTAAAGQHPVPGNEGPAPTGATKHGRVLGKLNWQGISPHDKLVRVNVSLAGEDVATRDIRLGRDFRIGRGYEFRSVPPGAYRLVAEVAGTTMWDLKVEVTPDKDTVLDLGDSNSSAPAGFDPPAAD